MTDYWPSKDATLMMTPPQPPRSRRMCFSASRLPRMYAPCSKQPNQNNTKTSKVFQMWPNCGDKLHQLRITLFATAKTTSVRVVEASLYLWSSLCWTCHMLHALGDMVRMAYYITKITDTNEGEVTVSSEFDYKFLWLTKHLKCAVLGIVGNCNESATSEL